MSAAVNGKGHRLIQFVQVSYSGRTCQYIVEKTELHVYECRYQRILIILVRISAGLDTKHRRINQKYETLQKDRRKKASDRT